MRTKPYSVPAGKFKATCLQLMDEVCAHHSQVIITKHGKPIAKLVPIDDTPTTHAFGSMKHTITIIGDIIGPTEVEWDAMK